MESKRNRREWLRGAAIGAAGAGIVAASGCGSSNEQNKAQEKSPLLAAAGPSLQVICHGMMAFKLPKPGTMPYNMEIHIPVVADGNPKYSHVYRYGNRPDNTNYNMSNLTQGGEYELTFGSYTSPKALPSRLYKNRNLLLFSSNNKCVCTVPASTNAKRWCKITLPVPEEYQGYVDGGNSDNSPIFKGTDTMYCTNPFDQGSPYPYPLDKVTSIPLVHVFRYKTFSAAALVQKTTSSSTSVWDTSSGYKLFFYAEPAYDMGMTLTNKHLQKLDDMLGMNTSHLDFTYPAKLVAPPGSGDGQIDDGDLDSLATIGVGLSHGGNPADCISGYGS
ncbi:MAG TPA: hypothetical protein VGN17_26565 [Bryobacteraceae bacterium]|jgi:hypothetical protein